MKSATAILALCLLGCATKQSEIAVVAEEDFTARDLSHIGLPKLSDYGFFRMPMKNLMPTDSVVPYALNSALFTDYAYKKRFIKFPQGKAATYHATETFDFPAGTILIKNFYYPADFLKPNADWRILETRLLVLEGDLWKPLTYIWNEAQTDALLDVAGKSVAVSWMHTNRERRSVSYAIPNQNQCKSCHMKHGQVMPIGPTARQLNRVAENDTHNQLTLLKTLGKLTNLPPLGNVPQLAAYEDITQPVNARARAWLEINCAHCHRPEGPAKTSGLHLLANVTNPLEIGIGKAPVAAGKGSGGLLYDIVPGNPDQSILHFRISSNDPGVMMPELGRTVVPEEGADLIRQWILGLN